MILLDTDILTLIFASHARSLERMRAAPEAPAISTIARIEVLQGRFGSILKAADEWGGKLGWEPDSEE